MDDKFLIDVAKLHRSAEVTKRPYSLSILREGLFSVSVERLPLIEYFVYFDHPVKAEQIKVKLYRTLDGKWYDKSYSEEAELYSPEFGVPDLNKEIKEAIDAHESLQEKVGAFI